MSGLSAYPAFQYVPKIGHKRFIRSTPESVQVFNEYLRKSNSPCLWQQMKPKDVETLERDLFQRTGQGIKPSGMFPDLMRIVSEDFKRKVQSSIPTDQAWADRVLRSIVRVETPIVAQKPAFAASVVKSNAKPRPVNFKGVKGTTLALTMAVKGWSINQIEYSLKKLGFDLATSSIKVQFSLAKKHKEKAAPFTDADWEELNKTLPPKTKREKD